MVVKMFRQMKPVMDEKVMWFVYEGDNPIAIWINLPDLNQWFKHLNGKFNLLAKLKFLWIKKTHKCRKFTGLVFGVVPEWQLGDIYRGMIQFMGLQLIGLALIAIFPQIALWLPTLIYGK